MKQIKFSVDNHKLRGTLFFPQNLKIKNPAILFIHGWTSEKKRSYQYVKALSKLGYISFLFDMRGHGKSEGDINKATTREFLKDVLAAYDYFTNIKGVDKNNINLVASSFGCYLATLLSERRKVKSMALRVPADYPNETFDKPKMKASGSDNPDIFNWRRQLKEPGETFGLEAMSKFNGKILILESEKDKVVPHETIKSYMDAVKDKSKLTHIVMKGAPHSIKEGPFRDEVEKQLVSWFKR